MAAAHWIGLRGDTDRALPVLTAGLDDPNPWVVVAALTALDEMGEAARPVVAGLDRVRGKDGVYAARLIESIRGRFPTP